MWLLPKSTRTRPHTTHPSSHPFVCTKNSLVYANAIQNASTNDRPQTVAKYHHSRYLNTYTYIYIYIQLVIALFICIWWLCVWVWICFSKCDCKYTFDAHNNLNLFERFWRIVLDGYYMSGRHLFEWENRVTCQWIGISIRAEGKRNINRRYISIGFGYSMHIWCGVIERKRFYNLIENLAFVRVQEKYD